MYLAVEGSGISRQSTFCQSETYETSLPPQSSVPASVFTGINKLDQTDYNTAMWWLTFMFIHL